LNFFRSVTDSNPFCSTIQRVITHAYRAVGIQVSQSVRQINVSPGIETYGGTGDSLVKEVVVRLSTIALSIKAWRFGKQDCVSRRHHRRKLGSESIGTARRA
jgi:hypothetical protein